MSDVTKAAADVTKAAGQATAAAVADEKVAQGFLRRNIWSVVAIAVGLAMILVWAVLR
jgi:hypothetical protein